MNKSLLKSLCTFYVFCFIVNTASTQTNFVRVWTQQQPLKDDNLVSTATNLQQVTQVTQYFDGLGRSSQTVTRGITPLGQDLVIPVVYDAFGREQYKYLPYASLTTDGTYKSAPLTEQNNFYSDANANSPILGQGETYYYGQNLFEASPLNRVLETQAPGNSWVGSGRGIQMKNLFNTDLDLVKNWVVTNSGTVGTFGSYAVSTAKPEYDAGELYKTITIDEMDHQTIEFKDKDGKVILKKVQLIATTTDNGTGSSHDNWLCTYYLYDDLNNLRCVIQPAGVELIKGSTYSWALTDANMLAEQCFRYEYDSRNRMIMKKVPGAAVVNTVYDARDRVVMTQDGNLQALGRWMITGYDALNHPIKTGLLTDATTPVATHRSNAASSTIYPTTSGSNFELLTETYYDDYTWFSSSGSPFAGTVTPGTFDVTEASDFLTASTTIFPYPQAVTQQKLNTGFVTGTKIKVLGTTSQYLYTVIYYDENERISQTESINITGKMDVTTTQYSFDGKLLVKKVTQSKGPGGVYNILVTRNSYDPAGRLTAIKKSLNGEVDHQIVAYTYDELGQLKTKQMDPAFNGSTGLSNLAYDYNIRGWLLGLNRTQSLTTNTVSGRKFAYELGYDKTSTKAGENFNAVQYNGNITGVIWKSSGDGIRRKYDYAYDNANRLLKADFEQNNGGTSTWDKLKVDYSVKMGDGSDATSAYDNNGNIKKMQQWGLKITGSSQIDDLTYHYANNENSNRLINVSDGFNDNLTTLGDFRVSALNPVQTKTLTTEDYKYDVNGNVVKDLNKDLGNGTVNGIVYNHLNLPQTITVYKSATLVKGTITYTYDAHGNKLKKVTIDQSTSGKTITTTTTYVDGFEYESKITIPADAASPDYTDLFARSISHEEGRIRRRTSDNWFFYDYFIKDHLGNVRMVLTEEQQTIYYPAATLEGTYSPAGTTLANSMINYEKGFYNVDNSKVVAESSIPSWVSPAETVANTKLYYNNNGNPPPNTSYPASCTPLQTDGSAKVYKLNATTSKTGLEFVIKVMAGDIVDIFGKSYYLNTTNITNSNSTPLDLNALVTNLLTSPGNPIAAKGVLASQLNTLNTGLVPSTFFRGNNSEATTTVPKAYINYIFLDDQFKYAGGNFSRVGASGSVKNHWNADVQLQNISAPKNGYLFVYVSNESNFDVFFDNLQVVHKPGPILEETHYYPFGLTMAGISSRAAGSLINKRGFQGKEIQNKEFSDGSGLELYDFGSRDQDPQLGRWWTIDPKAEKYLSSSPYNFVDNNPVNRIDPTGKDWFYYQAKGDELPSWHYKKGRKATYTNADGKIITTKQGYQYLVTFTYNKGETWGGSKRGTLTIYNQDKVAKPSDAFSGAGIFTGNFTAAAKGNYMMHLNQRNVMPKVNYNSDNDNPNPPANTGMQKIEDGTIVKHPDGSTDNVNRDYGNYRIRLNPTDGSVDRGLYLHGKDAWYNSRTHGCVCEKDQVVLQYIWEHKEITGNVPFAIDQPIDLPKQE